MRAARWAVGGLVTAALGAAVWVTAGTAAGPREDLKPAHHWVFDPKGTEGGRLHDRVGQLHGRITGRPEIAAGTAVFADPAAGVTLKQTVTPADAFLPTEAFTLIAWVRVDEPTEWGGILSCLQDNGAKEKGFVLGFDQAHFLFGLATRGADDGDGKLTYLRGRTAYQIGRWYHVAAVYDGKRMQLFVNGEPDGESAEQSGPVLYADAAPLVLARYTDADEDYPADIALREVLWCPRAVSAEQLAAHYRPDADRAVAPPTPVAPKFVVQPYLQSATRTSIVLMCETNRPTACTAEYGETTATTKRLPPTAADTFHEIKLDGLQPKTRYFYRLTCTDADGRAVQSRFLSFTTAVEPTDAWGFAVVGDTQRNPAVTGRLARRMWERRPHFVLHCGDVVDDGPLDWQWRGDLFAPCQELFGRVPVFPCIGNHEKDDPRYYKYFSLPAPEHRYRFRYGNAEFFALDTNKPRTAELLPGGAQYTWLDRALSASSAQWKVCFHHHPVYSSDSDDFGDAFAGKAFDGDLRLGPLGALYEKHRVDVVFNGHIHLYERSWPVRAGKVDPAGVVHVTSGGGGGSLEDFAPTPTWFKAECRADYHFLHVTVFAGELTLKAFDQDGRLFDQWTRRK